MPRIPITRDCCLHTPRRRAPTNDFASLVFSASLVDQPGQQVIGWSIRLGLLIMVIGFLQGGLMTGPTTEQAAIMETGAHMTTIGAHTVSAVDGGPGLPILGVKDGGWRWWQSAR